MCIRDRRYYYIPASEAFKISSTYGLPVDYIRDRARQYGLDIDMDEFENERRKHQEISRAGAEKKFGGHGLGADEGITPAVRLHTATHLLHQALINVLGSDVKQAGSDINSERARFDFTFDRRLTDEEVKEVENLVNEKIREDLPVRMVELPKEEALASGALHSAEEKYPDNVKIYYIGESLDNAFNKEFCGGPHVTRTGEIGEFKLVKQESVGRGIRRLRGVIDY